MGLASWSGFGKCRLLGTLTSIGKVRLIDMPFLKALSSS